LARRLQISRPDARILYIAFNKSVAVEAVARMPANVEARTGHSLAWAQVGEDFWGKTPYGKKMLGSRDQELAAKAKYLRARPAAVGKALGVSRSAAEVIITAVGHFANSADERLDLAHIEQVCRGGDFSKGQILHLLRVARQYWEDIATPLSDPGQRLFQASQDHLRKLWALSGPDFTIPGSGAKVPAQILFLDEAQDTPPVLARVVDQQVDMQQVLVGDRQQAIYGFAGSVDYLSGVAIDTELALTTSYRFGPGIEGVANRFLTALGATEQVTGYAENDVVGRVENPDAVLTRTNAGMLDEIVAEAEKGRRVGLLSTSRQDLDGLVQTTAYLRDGAEKPRQWHPVLSRYDSWGEVQAEARQATASTELQVAVRIVDAWPLRRLAAIVADSVEVVDAARTACDVVVVTAHKAKGLEWDSVRIGSDFYGPHRAPPKASKTKYDDPEHLRLDYVAVTRAKKALDLGSLRWIQTYRPGADVQISPLSDAGAMSCEEVDDLLLSLVGGKK
ncbi:MAG: hypothetical protein L0H31_07535, partial [Nocardioidaceae bacterium]|nr:hypothetical protein [Nocardioidaceae bacterium]